MFCADNFFFFDTLKALNDFPLSRADALLCCVDVSSVTCWMSTLICS